LNLAKLYLFFNKNNKTIKERKPINNKKKKTKKRSLKTHHAKSGYKLEVALQLKCRGTITCPPLPPREHK
jgi:hypothetical protein